jgi:predicted kinase
MAGSPASGKSELVEQLKSVFGFIEINPDIFQELLNKTKIVSDTLVLKKLRMAVEAGKGIIVNYTGKSGQYDNLIPEIEKHGYRSFMIYMWIDDMEILKRRETKRAEKINRKVDPEYLSNVFKSIQWNMKKYKDLFTKNGRGFFLFNSFHDLDSVEYTEQSNLLFNKLNRWLLADNQSPTNDPTKKKFLRHIISEDEQKKLITQDIIETIKEECSDFFQQLGDGLLYRGVPGGDDDFLYQEYPTNRKPTASSEEFHNFLNKVFKAKGFKTNRSNSVFCTGDWTEAASYGNVYVVFPKNGFNFLWSPKITDAYNNPAIFKETKIGKKIYDTLDSLMNKIPYHDTFDIKYHLSATCGIVLRSVLHFSYGLFEKPPIYFYRSEDKYSKNLFTSNPKYEIIADGATIHDVFPFIENLSDPSGLPNKEIIEKHVHDFLSKTTQKSKFSTEYINMTGDIFDMLLMFFLNKFLPKSKTEKLPDISPSEIDVDYRENDDLYAAMASRNEIMLSGSDGVYLIRNGSSLLDEVLDAAADANRRRK